MVFVWVEGGEVRRIVSLRLSGLEKGEGSSLFVLLYLRRGKREVIDVFKDPTISAILSLGCGVDSFFSRVKPGEVLINDFIRKVIILGELLQQIG